MSRSLGPVAAPSLTILSAEGEPIARRGAIIGEPVDVMALPPHVGQAFIAIEDRRFFRHVGIDPWGIGRAMVRNLRAGRVREGGSTISQQLAKTSFLSPARTPDPQGAGGFDRALAGGLAEQGGDPQPLSLQRLFRRQRLRPARRRPPLFQRRARGPDPVAVGDAGGGGQRPEPAGADQESRSGAGAGTAGAARDGRGRLHQRGARWRQPARPASAAAPGDDVPTGTYFADWVLPQAAELSDEGYGQRLVQTTLEGDLQRLAVRTIRRAGLGRAQAALVAMRLDGRVVAMVGGRDYAASPFNRAVQARRQPGSAFKLFVYLAAFRAGLTPETPVNDIPIRLGNWQPRNYGDSYRGPITLREAVA